MSEAVREAILAQYTKTLKLPAPERRLGIHPHHGLDSTDKGQTGGRSMVRE